VRQGLGEISTELEEVAMVPLWEVDEVQKVAELYVSVKILDFNCLATFN